MGCQLSVNIAIAREKTRTKKAEKKPAEKPGQKNQRETRTATLNLDCTDTSSRCATTGKEIDGWSAGCPRMLFLDDVYFDSRPGTNPGFRRVKAPTGDELTQLTYTIACRVSRYLARRGLLERDTGNCYLTPEPVFLGSEKKLQFSKFKL